MQHSSNRRAFLVQGVSTLTALSVFRQATWADESPRIRFGFTLYGMKKLKVADALRTCAEIGYDCVELVCMPDWPAAPETLSKVQRDELKGQLANSGLTVASLMENVSPLADEKTHAANLERLKRACGLSRDLVPLQPPVIETVLGGKPAEWLQVRDKMVQRLADWEKVATAEHVVIALKPHVAGALHTPDGAVWLMDQLKSPWLRLAYDYSHFELRQIPMKASLDAMLPQTVFIHVKDSAGTADKVQFLLPGDGRINYGELFRYLKQARYNGPLVVEVSGQIHTRPDYDPVAAAKHCYAKLARLLAEAGLRPMRQG